MICDQVREGNIHKGSEKRRGRQKKGRPPRFFSHIQRSNRAKFKIHPFLRQHRQPLELHSVSAPRLFTKQGSITLWDNAPPPWALEAHGSWLCQGSLHGTENKAYNLPLWKHQNLEKQKAEPAGIGKVPKANTFLPLPIFLKVLLWFHMSKSVDGGIWAV